MVVNPSLRPEHLNNPTQRANEINDPQFQNQQGYFGYDLTHAEFPTPRFGEVTPTMHLDTAPADRIVCHDNLKTVLNQINGNFLSTLNQYVDSFYVPLRSLYPINYEKLIPNPTKGDDLPNKALPQVPLFGILADYFRSWEYLDNGDGSHVPYKIYGGNGVVREVRSLIPGVVDWSVFSSTEANLDNPDYVVTMFSICRMAFLAYVCSRGQLMDYLGIQIDDDYSNQVYNRSEFQTAIDNYFDALYNLSFQNNTFAIYGYSLDLTDNQFDPSTDDPTYVFSNSFADKSLWRQAISDIFERGEQLFIDLGDDLDTSELQSAYSYLYNMFDRFLPETKGELGLVSLDEVSDPFASGYYVNMSKFLAYQQSIAHYFVNNTVDNIFTSELFMQNLASVMFPSSLGFTSSRPVFDFNGVSTEYDLITTGATSFSLLSPSLKGVANRQYVWMSIMLLMRRSLRYGDYFATARPNMLAVGQLSIAVDGNAVSPIDITQNLLKQRYLNAANYIGSGVLQWYASMYGVTPSDMGSFPRFLAHRKIVLQNQITNNTSENQGAQTTNIVGYSDNYAFDVFIDDFGVIISVTSYDVLPVYLSGIDSCYHFADRFDYFNPMLQNIGDQPIRLSELYGNPVAYSKVFGYTMRNAEYKFKVSRAHGGFVNSLPGFLMKYPYGVVSPNSDIAGYDKISPEFIRDKPYYLDYVIPSITGTSPASYFHFVCACVNQVHAARKIQATPPVLF